jgi:hypothetical protein
MVGPAGAAAGRARWQLRRQNIADRRKARSAGRVLAEDEQAHHRCITVVNAAQALQIKT